MTQQKSIKRSKCVILDAMIIITAHELGVWAHMIERLDIVVPSIIVRDEALFYTRKECGIPEDINLRKLITQGKIREIAASVEEIADLQNIFDSIFLSGLHEGESEALAILKSDRVTEAFFCTSDIKAIQALAMIDKSDRGLSFERMLGEVGMRKPLPVHYTDGFFKNILSNGKTNRILGRGMKRTDRRRK